jgi:DNA gyrase subunit A
MLAGALVVREHEELVFISQNGMVQRTGVRGINRYGRASQGVKVMNLREGDAVSAVALVMESERDDATELPLDLPEDGVVDVATDDVVSEDTADASPEVEEEE